MQSLKLRRPGARAPVVACITGAALGAGACQTYAPAPLDLGAHRDDLAQRTTRAADIDAFVQRLDDAGADVPDRFSFDDGLSPAEGEVLALFYNPDLRVARMQAGIARATSRTAGLWDDPVFGFDGAEIMNPSAPFQFGLTLGFTLPVSGRLDVEKQRAGAAYEAALREIADEEWNTRARVRSAWARWTVAALRVDVRTELVDELEGVAQLTDTLARAGELSRADTRVFRVALASQRADLVLARADVEDARAALLHLLGLPVDADIHLLPGLPDAGVPTQAIDPGRRLVESNTTLALRRAEYRVAEESLRLEIRKQIPDIQFGAGYGSEDNDDRLLLGVSVPIPVFNGNRQAIEEARAQRELARALAETTWEQLALDLRRAAIAREQAATRRHQFEHDVLTLAREQLDELHELADLGEVDTFLLFESITSLFDTRLRLLELRLDERTADIEYARLLGPDAPIDPAPVSPEAAATDTGDES